MGRASVLARPRARGANFLAGEDYSFELGGAPDAEFEALCDAVEEEIRGLVEAGAVGAGACVALPDVPSAALQQVPLVEGEWIDRYVVELAEWGALLRRKGYERRSGEDHLLAWDQFVRPKEGQALDITDREIESVRTEARANLERFPGRATTIDGRPYSVKLMELLPECIDHGVDGHRL